MSKLLSDDEIGNCLVDNAIANGLVTESERQEMLESMATDPMFIGAFRAVEQAVIERCAVVCDEVRMCNPLQPGDVLRNQGANACSEAIRTMAKGEQA